MPEVLAVSDVRKRWAEVFRQAVSERHPVAIERGGGERALLIGLDELELLIAGYEFHPEAFFEPEAVSVWLPELGLYGRGAAFEEAQDDLLAEVRDYVDEYLSEAQLYLRAPNRAAHFPFVMKALVADAEERLAAVVFASPEARSVSEMPASR
jgi:Antitoxin of toxin-antitoxin, RelE / RelB, TA system